jgi:glycosylphosphatidylinositol transamidase (GPIT) subunit GPI8
MKVLATTEVNEYWENLITILYEKGYFGLEVFAQRYVDELIYDIKANLPNRISKPAPKHFEKYGEELQYASFKKNRRTTWYVFFETYEENEEIIYLVCHIENNHTAAQYLG